MRWFKKVSNVVKGVSSEEERWCSQIGQALEWKKKRSFEHKWEDYQKYYEHRFQNPLEPRFNLIKMFVDSLVPSLVFQRPSIINTPKRPEFSYWASFFDSVDNWLVEETELRETMKLAVIHSFLFNTSIVQLGYDFPENYPSDDATDEYLTFKPLPKCVDRRRKINKPWLDLIPPEQFICAKGTKSMANCRWAGKFMILPTEYMKTFPMVDKRKLTSTHIPNEVAKREGNKWMQSEVADGYTAFYEIHDAENKTFFWLDTNWRYILPPTEDRLQVDGLPFEVLNFNRNLDSIWGTPDSTYIESQFLEGNECRRDARLQRKVSLVKAFYDSNLLDKEDMVKMISGDPMIGIPVDVPADKRLSECIALVQPHVQMELPQYWKELLYDAQLLVGAGPNQLGTFASGRRTAEEVRVVEEKNMLRSGERREDVARLIGDHFARINQFVTKYWKAQVVRQVVGIEGAMYWVKARPEEFKDIASNLTTKTNVESLAPVSKESKRRELIDFLGVIAKFEGLNPMPLIQQFLSTLDWVKATSVLPQAQQTATLGLPEFAQAQSAMQQNPQLGAMQQTNFSNLGSAITAMTAEGANNE